MELANTFWPDFVEVDGCVFVPWDAPDKVPNPEGVRGHIYWESFHNHLHMIDIVNHKAGRQSTDEDDGGFYDDEHPDFVLMCQLGKTIAQMWLEKLKADFPNYDFRVYYTERDNPVVRFHRIRDGEPNWLNEADWRADIGRGIIIVYDTRDESHGQKIA